MKQYRWNKLFVGKIEKKIMKFEVDLYFYLLHFQVLELWKCLEKVLKVLKYHVKVLEWVFWPYEILIFHLYSLSPNISRGNFVRIEAYFREKSFYSNAASIRELNSNF